jgi:hypothetical protein
MKHHIRNNDEEQVLAAVREMNQLWAARNTPEKLDRYFHRDMIAACAGESGFRVGQETCIAGWTGFCKNVSDLSFKELEPLVRVFPENNAAVVAYTYECQFTQQGQKRVLKGRDLFTLIKASSRWQVISDHFS